MAPPRKPENYVTINCPVCDKEITYHKSWPVTTCSLACRKALYYPDKRTTTTCPTCGKVFEYLKTWPRKYCSRLCAAKATVDNIDKWQPSLYTATCEQCGKDFETTPKRTRGRFCSRRCHGDWLKEHAPTGEDHPSWKGGTIPYYGKDWRQQRRAARRRDNYTCQRCGITEDQLRRRLDVHHIRRFGDFSDYREANKVSNLISLCPVCHKTVEHATNGRQPIDA